MSADQPRPPALIRRFRKKPIVIEAIQFTSEHLDECVAFCGGEYEYKTASQDPPYGEVLHIKTLEGTMTAVLGDWIIKGVKGEFYPCKPDILGATYEPADLAPMSNVSETPRTDAARVESILCTEGGDEECTVYPCVEHVESDFARQLERELTAALARAEKAEEDTRRLDWLEQQFGLAIWRGVMIDDNKPVFDIHEPREEGWDDALGEQLGTGRTLRAAIDAALTPTKEPAL